MDAIAKKLGLTPKWVDTSFGTIFSDQQAGKFDLVASSATITPAREKKVTFSDPYFDADQSLMVQKGSDLATVDDITSDTTIAVQEGTTGQDYAENADRCPVQAFAEIGTAFNAVQAGQVDGGHQRLCRLRLRAEEVPAARRGPGDPDGRALRLPDAEDEHRADRRRQRRARGHDLDGTYQDIFNQWFHKDPPKEFQPTS